MLRWMILLLLTLNVCYLLWVLVSPVRSGVSPEPWPDGVAPLEMVDLRAGSGTEQAEADSAVDAGAVFGRCWRIGPFLTGEQRDGFVRSHLSGIPVAILQGEQVVEGGWRVFLPPAEDREAATGLQETLQSAAEEAGEVMESFVMTEGPRANGVSLGLFREESNARALVSRVEAMGLTAGIDREMETRSAEWLEVFVSDRWMDGFRRSAPVSRSAGLQVTENLCQTIAPQPYFP